MKFRFGKQPDTIPSDQEGEWEHGNVVPILNPQPTADRPMGIYLNTLGPLVDPTGATNLLPGPLARDYDHTPITFTRFATRWGDMQLKNGLANYAAMGKIYGYRGEGWYDVVVPTVPGQTRRIGGALPSNYVFKGPAPSQWQNWLNAGPGSQPSYPGGPGQVASSQLVSPADALAGGG
jgi:hypothetical protein